MSIKIVPFTPKWEEGALQFNRRLREGGVEVQFPGTSTPDWLPKSETNRVYQEYFLAVDDGGAVRGGYILKTQDFLVDGEIQTIADLRLPLSEGIVDSSYNFVGLQLVTNALTRQPRLFALGMGGYEQALPRLLKAFRWSIVPVPFLFRVVRPGPFLRNIRPLRSSAFRRFACDLAASTGLGWAGFKAAEAMRPPCRVPRGVEWREVECFGEAADRVWASAKSQCSLVAVRDRQIVDTLYPSSDPRFVRLEVSRRGEPIGWAVGLATPMSDHKQFGNMKVGTLVDGLAAPPDVADVVACARRALEARGVDLIVSNQGHDAWVSALTRNGFRRGPTNFLFAASPRLSRLLPDFPAAAASFHLNRGDGDGPIHL